jgi:vacuolar-type H+-ATPase subunit E/Vma4
MGVDIIIRRIDEDTANEVERIRAETAEEVRTIMVQAQREADNAYDKILAEGKQEIRSLTRRIRAEASIEARNLVRTEREAIITRCFDAVVLSLAELTQAPAYEMIMEGLITDGIAELDARDVTVISTERDRELVTAIITKLQSDSMEIALQPECAITTGGVILKSASKFLTVDNTLEARLERFREDLVFGIAQRLYGEF